ncbi:MAG: peptide chain release factor N(5)-glutamine methyltransferase, partial [Candidatus Competibacteraceae bacterium]|nr:peptide chain release factor N(5)-glutamine methyltransferase [Candidatus Competibacteraceae bacterium]
PRLDAEVLLAHALDRSRAYLRAWPEHIPEAGQRARFQELLQRRLRGEPVAYILGRREFWSLSLAISPAVLVPRPETELLVVAALSRLPEDTPATVADLGTGSGAVALAIARERPQLSVTATDLVPAALAVAEQNARQLGLTNLRFQQGSWCQALGQERFDLIVSNPPYIPEQDPHLGQGELRFEPRNALVAGPDGLEAIRAIAACAPAHLHPGGWLILEHGYDQGPRVAELLRHQGLVEVVSHSDLAGHDRVALGRRPID